MKLYISGLKPAVDDIVSQKVLLTPIEDWVNLASVEKSAVAIKSSHGALNP